MEALPNLGWAVAQNSQLEANLLVRQEYILHKDCNIPALQNCSSLKLKTIYNLMNKTKYEGRCTKILKHFKNKNFATFYFQEVKFVLMLARNAPFSLLL